MEEHSHVRSGVQSATQLTVAEVDCPWFIGEWLTDHPNFPVATPQHDLRST